MFIFIAFYYIFCCIQPFQLCFNLRFFPYYPPFLYSFSIVPKGGMMYKELAGVKTFISQTQIFFSKKLSPTCVQMRESADFISFIFLLSLQLTLFHNQGDY